MLYAVYTFVQVMAPSSSHAKPNRENQKEILILHQRTILQRPQEKGEASFLILVFLLFLLLPPLSSSSSSSFLLLLLLQSTYGKEKKERILQRLRSEREPQGDGRKEVRVLQKKKKKTLAPSPAGRIFPPLFDMPKIGPVRPGESKGVVGHGRGGFFSFFLLPPLAK